MPETSRAALPPTSELEAEARPSSNARRGPVEAESRICAGGRLRSRLSLSLTLNEAGPAAAPHQGSNRKPRGRRASRSRGPGARKRPASRSNRVSSIRQPTLPTLDPPRRRSRASARPGSDSDAPVAECSNRSPNARRTSLQPSTPERTAAIYVLRHPRRHLVQHRSDPSGRARRAGPRNRAELSCRKRGAQPKRARRIPGDRARSGRPCARFARRALGRTAGADNRGDRIETRAEPPGSPGRCRDASRRR